MAKEGVMLELRNSWKWFLYISELVAIGGFIFLLINLVQMVGFNDTASLFLLAIFIVGIIGCVYTLFYANNHKVKFTNEGIEKIGVFGTKHFLYEDMEEVWFAPRFWDMKSAVPLFSDSNTLVFDYRYENMKEAAEFIANLENNTQKISVYYDQEKVAS